MDAKITKLRLSRMLSYDWLKIIFTSAAVIVVWVLIFTMTATRITSAQTFTVCNYVGNASLSAEFSKAYNKAYADNKFSDEVLKLTTVDLVSNGKYAWQILEARVATDEGDVMFISQQPDEQTAYVVESVDETTGEKVEETLYKTTYLQSFLRGYRFKLHNLDMEDENSYFRQMESYLNRYYDDYKNADALLHEDRVEQDFLARIKRTKDKRYKKQAQIKQGIAESVERIEKYRDALVAFHGYLDSGLIALTKTSYTAENEQDYSFEGTYSINLCPNAETMSGLSSIVGYNTVYEDEETGKDKITLTAKDMNVCLFNMNGKEEEFRYEAVLYLVDLIESVRTK